MPPALHIPPPLLAELVAKCRDELPNEACGFLAGRDGVASHVLPVVNELASPTAFRTEPRSTFAAFRRMRELGVELVAVYHSHPTGDAVPSRRDIDGNTYGTVPWVIVGAGGEVRAWVLGADSATEISSHSRDDPHPATEPLDEPPMATSRQVDAGDFQSVQPGQMRKTG